MEQRRKRNIMDESQVKDMEEPEEELTRREEHGEGEETEWIEQETDKVSTVKRIPTCRKKNKRTRVGKVRRTSDRKYQDKERSTWRRVQVFAMEAKHLLLAMKKRKEKQ